MSKLIYLSGKARSGKDEFAKIWCKLNPSFKRMAFADAIKSKAAEILGVKLEDLSNPETKEKYRAFLIFGGQLVRSVDPLYWVKQVVNDPYFKTGDVIITDVRFPNEINELDYWATKFDKEIIRIRMVASEEVRLARGANPEFFNDISETALDNFDPAYFTTFVNDSTLEHLEDCAKFIEKTIDW